MNGFFWGGKPVANNDSTAVHTTALGVSDTCVFKFKRAEFLLELS